MQKKQYHAQSSKTNFNLNANLGLKEQNQVWVDGWGDLQPAPWL